MIRQSWALPLFILFAPAWAAEPVITTFAGGGTGPTNGDGGPATAAVVMGPMSVAVDGAGNVYIAEGGEYFEVCRVRKVDRAGNITTVAGNGTRDVSGENVPATSVSVCPRSLAFDAAGNLYIGEHSRVRRVTPTGIISTVAGTGTWGYSGDGGSAKSARLGIVEDLAVDTLGQIYIVDNASNRIRRVDTKGVIRTIAGNGDYHTTGDGGPALSAGMSPRAIAVDGSGNVVFADSGNNSLRRVSAGTVTRIAGAGSFRSDPLAVNSSMYIPRGLTFGRNGELYIANDGNLVHVVSPAGILKVVAGVYNDSTFDPYGAWWGYDGDNGPATSAVLNRPNDVAVDSGGNLYIADNKNNRVRKVTPVQMPPVPFGVTAFQPVRGYAVGAYTNTLDIGDFNRDGRQDVVVATSSWTGSGSDPATDYRLNVFLQQADGTLAAPQRLAFAQSRHVGMVNAVDLNRDGFSDVVLATEAGLNVYLGSAAGLQARPLLRGVTNAEVPSSILTGDMDLDGNLDIIAWMAGRSEGGTAPTDQRGITIFYGDGRGGASRMRFLPQQQEGGRLAWADVNRDGRTDLVMTWMEYPKDSGVMVFAHDGVDAFRAPTVVRTGLGNFSPHGIAVGDFDGDGLQDVVLSRATNAPDAQLALLRATPENQLRFVKAWKTFDVPTEILGRDWNNDGRDDLLVLHSGWSSVGLQAQVPNLYTSWLDTEVKYRINESGNAAMGSLATGDLNHDGCIDVAVADRNNGLQVLYSTRCYITARPSPPLLPPATPGTAGSQGVIAMPTMATATSAARASAFGTWSARAWKAAAQVPARVQKASAPAIVGGSLFALFLLLVGWRLPLLRRRWS